MIRIAVLDDFQSVSRTADWTPLAGRAEPTIFPDHVTGEALADRLQPFEAIVAIRERTPLRRALLERLPHLRLVATIGMRNQGIDVGYLRGRGIPVTGTEGGGTPTAELAFGLVLALSRNIPAEDRSLRAGNWQTLLLGNAVRGRTLGLLGLGKLGTEVAAMGRAFGMEVIAWSPNLTPERTQAAGVRLVDKQALFAGADFLSLHMVLGERSRGIVDAQAIGAMRRTAFLVNTSRAGLLDQAALVAALHEGRLAGAALDVFETEPLPPDDPILAAPRTILTPHLGYATRETFERAFPQMIEGIGAFLTGAPVRLLTHD